MSPRFIINIALALAGGFLVAASQAFRAGLTGWLAFAVGLGVLVVLGAAQLDRSRGSIQRALDGAAGALAIWTIVASVVFTGTTLTWLSLGEGLGFVAVALAGLVAHELSTERIVHAFEAVPAEARNGARAEQFSATT
jgi:hypothetical protein